MVLHKLNPSLSPVTLTAAVIDIVNFEVELAQVRLYWHDVLDWGCVGVATFGSNTFPSPEGASHSLLSLVVLPFRTLGSM